MRTDILSGHARRAHRKSAPALAPGFTLIEILIVLVILGLVAAIAATRGPARSVGLDLRASASMVADSLRVARSRAIAADRPVSFVLDVRRHAYSVGGSAPDVLAPELALSMTTIAGGVRGEEAAISFAPDGSSSGGRVVLSVGDRREAIDVDWLTGRVSVTDGR